MARYQPPAICAKLIPAIYAFSTATLWRKVKVGTFPKPVKLGPRITAWRVEAIRGLLQRGALRFASQLYRGTRVHCLAVHKNTVRRWIKASLPTVGGRGKSLIPGSQLRPFLEGRHRSARVHRLTSIARRGQQL